MEQPTTVRSRHMTDEEKLAQIIALYQGYYITLASAKGLAKQHVGELADRVSWWNVKRE